MMRFDIDGLTEAELVDLNNRIVARLRFLQQARAHQRMLQFKLGDRVGFASEAHGLVVGTLIRYNRKSVTVITDAGQHWNVAPSLLQRVVDPNEGEGAIAPSVPARRT